MNNIGNPLVFCTICIRDSTRFIKANTISVCIIFFQTGKHGGLKLNRYFIIVFLFERLIPCNIVFFGFGSSTIFCFVLFSSLFPRVGGVHGRKD